MIGLLGKKLGMTHVYDEFGRRTAVTAVQVGPCTVLALREPPKHGYRAVQVGFEPVAASRVSKPVAGQFKKSNAGVFRHVREFRLQEPQDGLAVGQQLTVDLFKDNELVDVTGTSVGKGFQGGMKRWNWKGGRETHGSMQHRAPGSIGSTTTPGRVIKGHHLPGHMGADRVTIQSMRIVRRDLEHHLLLLEGSVPGPEEALVLVRRAVKKPGVIRAPLAIQTVVEEEDEDAAKKAKAKKK